MPNNPVQKSGSNTNVVTSGSEHSVNNSIALQYKPTSAKVNYDLSFDFGVEKFTSNAGWTNQIASTSNSLKMALFDIYRAMYSMCKLPEDHEYYIPDFIAKNARDCLSLIAHNTKLEMPNLLNRGGEALALTWSLPEGKCYLNIDEHDVDSFIICKNGEEVEESYSHDGVIDIEKFLSTLSTRFNADIS